MAALNIEGEVSARFEDESRSKLADEREGLKILFMDEKDEVLEEEIGAQLSAFNLVKRKLQDEIELEQKAIKILEDDKSKLNVQVRHLEKEVKDKDVKISNLSPSVNNLGSEVRKLRDHVCDLEEQVTTQAEENDRLREEVLSLGGTYASLKKKKSKEEKKDGDQFSGINFQMDVQGGGGGAENDKSSSMITAGLIETHHINLLNEKDAVSKKIAELEKKLQERGDEFSARVSALIREGNNLLGEEIKRLTEEKEGLRGGMLKLEESLKERDNLIADLEEKLNVKENETTSTLSTLTKRIGNLHEELGGERQKSTERVDQLESQNAELTGKIKDQQSTLKKQEETIKKLQEDSRLVKGRFIQVADRKMQEVAAEFQKSFEDKLRILGRRIRVAEQLHAENKESYKQMKEWCDQEHPWVDDQKKFMATCSVDVTQMMDRMEKSLINSVERKEEELLKRLSKVSGELKVSKEWVRFMMNEIRPLWMNLPSSPYCFNDKEEKEKALREKVRKLEEKVNKDKGVKLRLMKGMYDTQTKVAELEAVVVEKDEGMLKLGEEKVEAIRQLCMWIDYHQDRCHEKMLSTSKNKGGLGRTG